MVRGPLFLLPRKDLLLTRLLGIDGATYPLTTWTWTNPTAGLLSTCTLIVIRIINVSFSTFFDRYLACADQMHCQGQRAEH